MHIRPATRADIPALASLFRETVLVHGPEHYTEAQTLAWAASPLDVEQFEQFILGAQTYVAEIATDIAGFGGLAVDGHVTALYVCHDCLRQGVGSALLGYLIQQARRDRLQRLYAEASEFSLGLFKKFGFQQYAQEVVERYSVAFTRYLVEKTDL